MIITSYDLIVLAMMTSVLLVVYVAAAVLNKHKEGTKKMNEIMEDFERQQWFAKKALPAPQQSTPFRTLDKIREHVEPLQIYPLSPFYNPPVVHVPTPKYQTKTTIRKVDVIKKPTYHVHTSVSPAYRHEIDVYDALEDIAERTMVASTMESMMRSEQAEKTYEMMDKAIAEPPSNIVESVSSVVETGYEAAVYVAETTYESASSAYDSVSESVSDTYDSVSDSVSDFFSSDD